MVSLFLQSTCRFILIHQFNLSDDDDDDDDDEANADDGDTGRESCRDGARDAVRDTGLDAVRDTGRDAVRGAGCAAGKNVLNQQNFNVGVNIASTPITPVELQLFPKPTPLLDNATPTQKKLYECLESLHEMEKEVFSLEKVVHICN